MQIELWIASDSDVLIRITIEKFRVSEYFVTLKTLSGLIAKDHYERFCTVHFFYDSAFIRTIFDEE